jgi:EamA domain-containing membrane protein RarD
MNSTLITGTIIVTIALISYSIAVITEQRKFALSSSVLTFLTIGIILDITATCFMIAGSRRIPITFHGVLGYSALTAMLIDTILIWKTRIKGALKPSMRLHMYTRFAFGWWVLAYFVGGFVAMLMVHSK